MASRRRKDFRDRPSKPRATTGEVPITDAQKMAVDTMLQNPLNSQTENLQLAGYEKSVAMNHPGSVTKAMGFQEYLNQRVPDEKLARLINEGMMAEKAPAGYEDFVPDWANRFKFVELVAKLKGYSVNQPGPSVNVQFVNSVPRPNDGGDTNSIPRPKPDVIDGEVIENS